ncbi:Small glutamine-rich tetratricopeptide repeat-containing protein 2 [Coemansia sp. Benny D160-2]|nr:Small glutamine-rich tetratricopeptide repeat-containing protein 2 [Coemansia sp. Benny D160-2]
MQTPEEIRQRLAVGIVEYLDKAVADGHVASDGAESLEIAKQCIADAFGIDMGDESKIQALSLKPFSLDKVFEVYLKTQAKVGVDSNSSGEKDNGLAPASATDGISEEERKRADEFKTEGNRLMMGKDFAGAIDAYTKAIELVQDSAIYFGNRSAAFSQSGDHEKAVADAKQALELDAAYLKGYSRLGHAYFGLGKFAEAADAYEKGLELDPENKVMASSLTTTRAKLDMERGDGSPSAGPMPEARPSSASAGGGFDLGSLMSNPALMSMAQNMMANGGLDQLMNNPAVSRLAENYRNTGQMPNMSDMMNNPDIMNMARSLSGNASSGDGRGGSADANNGSNPLASLMNNPNMMNMAQQFMRNSQNNGNNSNSSNSGGDNSNNSNNSSS